MPVQPTLDPLPARSVHPGKTLSFFANVNDPDGVGCTFALVPSPDPTFPGATINPATGQFVWPVPMQQPLQALFLTVKITDNNGGTDSKQCAITVVNQAPVLEPVAPRTAHPGQMISFGLTATDPDNDPLTFEMVPNPNPSFPGAFLNAQSGQFFWAVPPQTPAQALILTVKVTDPTGLSDTKQCAITIANQPPVLDPLPPRNVHPGNLLSFWANATDPDNDPLTFEMVPNPNPFFPGAMLSPQGQFTWPVPFNQPLQALILTVKVSDPTGASDTKQCAITVVNQGPVLDALPARTVQGGKTLTFGANATDPDFDVLTFETVPMPDLNFPGAMLDPMSGQFTWFVQQGTAPGARILTVKVKDPSGASDTKQCVITVV